MSTFKTLISAAKNYGDVLPKYDGNPDSLELFISKVDKFIKAYGKTNERLNKHSLCLVISKLRVMAEVFVRQTFNKFKFLKEILYNFIQRLKNLQTKLNVKINENLYEEAKEKFITK